MSDRGEKIVVRFKDGRQVRGWCESFPPDGTTLLVESASAGLPQLVDLSDVKAVFGVKRFDGDILYLEDNLLPMGVPYGRETCVELSDGEKMRGYSQGVPVDGEGFFLFPCDPGSNNIWTFVLVSAVAKVKFGPRLAAA